MYDYCLFNFLKDYFMCMHVLLDCAPQACLLSKEVRMHLILLELEVRMAVNLLVGAGNQTQVNHKSNKYS